MVTTAVTGAQPEVGEDGKVRAPTEETAHGTLPFQRSTEIGALVTPALCPWEQPVTWHAGEAGIRRP